MCPSWSQMWAVRSSKSAMGSRVWNVRLIGDVLCNWRVMEPVRCWGRGWLDWTGAGLYTVVDSRTWAVLQWARLWTGDWHRGRREAQCRIQSRYAMSSCHCLLAAHNCCSPQCSVLLSYFYPLWIMQYIEAAAYLSVLICLYFLLFCVHSIQHASVLILLSHIWSSVAVHLCTHWAVLFLGRLAATAKWYYDNGVLFTDFVEPYCRNAQKWTSSPQTWKLFSECHR